jgi:hypothetical protein
VSSTPYITFIVSALSIGQIKRLLEQENLHNSPFQFNTFLFAELKKAGYNPALKEGG